MATWKGNPIKAEVDVCDEFGVNRAIREFYWRYQTTADVLSVYEGDTLWLSADYEHARLLWVLLDEWAQTYLDEHGMELLRRKYGTARTEGDEG